MENGSSSCRILPGSLLHLDETKDSGIVLFSLVILSVRKDSVSVIAFGGGETTKDLSSRSQIGF